MDRVKKQAPYVIVLLISGYLFYLATQFDSNAPEGRIGPAVWPKAVLLLSMLTCAYEILKNLFLGAGRHDIAGALDALVEAGPAGDEPPPVSHPRLLLAGIALTIAYAALIGTLGFFICTVLFIAGFTWIGRFRRARVIVLTSAIGGLVFMFVFMKVVYVSLPLGTGPFAAVSMQLMKLMGIR